MPKHNKPRAGSLQFWPRKRASKFLPRANWLAIDGNGLLGFIAYKAGMVSVVVKDSTEHSMTKGKKMIIPATVLEIPPIKIYSIRLYKNNKVMKEIVIDNSDKELKKIIKLSKKIGKLEDAKNYDDLRLIIYSVAKKTSIKKTPDLTEIGLGGSLEEKINFIKQHAGKEISISEIFKDLKLIDVRGLTKGKGFAGPVKRFGIGLKSHKSEKGRRRPGSLGPWHPTFVLFRVPMAGQLGMFTRVAYNNLVLKTGKISGEDINPKSGFKHYGKIKTEYIILGGSVFGPAKRQLLLTLPLRKTKKQEKKKYELVEIEK